MTKEEKAKAYDEALKAAIVAHKDEDRHLKATLERIFPALKESEDKRMIQYFKDLAPFDKADELYSKYGFFHKDAIVWLEKQGEHANFRNKIQIGDKVTRNEDGVLVNLSQLKRVAKKDEKQGEQKSAEWSEKTKGLDELQTYILSLVPNRPLDAIKVDSKNIRFLINKEQKLAWSEEDEKQARQIERIVHDDGCTQKLQKQIADWLKSLKERYTWKPSDEQMQALSNAGNSFRPFEEGHKILWSLYNDLKKLKG